VGLAKGQPIPAVKTSGPLRVSDIPPEARKLNANQPPRRQDRQEKDREKAARENEKPHDLEGYANQPPRRQDRQEKDREKAARENEKPHDLEGYAN